jgi:hypothetical protein
MSLTRTTTLLKHLQRTPAARTFSMSALRAAEGDTGAPRAGGQAQGDAFTKREQASEDYYVRQEEKKKLEALRQKIAEKEADIAKDREEAEKLTKKQ